MVGPRSRRFGVEGECKTGRICFVAAIFRGGLGAASVAAILAILCKRVQLLVGGFQIPNLDYAAATGPMTVTGWESGMAGAYQGMVYWPAPIEWGVCLGVVALAVLIFLLGVKFLPLRPQD